MNKIEFMKYVAELAEALYDDGENKDLHPVAATCALAFMAAETKEQQPKMTEEDHRWAYDMAESAVERVAKAWVVH